MSYLDVVAKVKEAIHLPVAAYSVSGEYAMIKAGAALAILTRKRLFVRRQLPHTAQAWIFI